jgi:hypothetical protein
MMPEVTEQKYWNSKNLNIILTIETTPMLSNQIKWQDITPHLLFLFPATSLGGAS